MHLILHDAPQSIAPWGMYVPSALAGAVAAPDGACGAQTAPALVSPSVDVANAAAQPANVLLNVTLLAPDGVSVVGSSSSPNQTATSPPTMIG